MYVPGCREWRVFRQADFAGKQVLYPVNPCRASCRRTGETFMICACKMLSYAHASGKRCRLHIMETFLWECREQIR